MVWWMDGPQSQVSRQVGSQMEAVAPAAIHCKPGSDSWRTVSLLSVSFFRVFFMSQSFRTGTVLSLVTTRQRLPLP